MNRDEKIKKITDYIKSGEKDCQHLSIGVEMENFIVDKDSLESISYFGKNGVGETLEYLAKDKGYVPYKEGEYTLGLEKGNVTISTEPGSQFEIAINSDISIKNLEYEYVSFFSKMLKYLDSKNQKVVTLGYHPNKKIEDIKILPKKRYGYMFDYFNTKGTMAHNMMKGTASLQVIIDYANEDDFKRKYFVANVLTPIFYGIFDNAYIFEKRPAKIYSIRQKIWENTDKERSGLFDIAFDSDISYKKYAEKILDTPIIFMEKDGEYISTGNKTLEEVSDEYELDDDLIFHALSIVFPDVRVKYYIELRMFDEIPYPLNFAAVAFIKGLFYNNNNLDRLYEIAKGTTYKEAMEGKKNVEKDSLKAVYLGKTILEHGKFLVELAEKGLNEEEKPYLKPLFELLGEGKTPRDKFEGVYKEKGLKEAVELMCINLENANV